MHGAVGYMITCSSVAYMSVEAGGIPILQRVCDYARAVQNGSGQATVWVQD